MWTPIRIPGLVGRVTCLVRFSVTRTYPICIRPERYLCQQVRSYARQTAPVMIPQFVSVSNLATLLKLRMKVLQSRMARMGFENTQHDFLLDSQTAALIGDELGFRVVSASDHEALDLVAQPLPTDASVPLRPPIVTIMGHVDHGKTTILDYLRKSSVAAGEHGGITQHIGAFSVSLGGKSKAPICFLDTPGHAAFLNMRRRGANVTDIVVLVVCAEDSVMPQTKEAIKHARQAGVAMIVAVNKIDRPDANPDKVLADLASQGVEIEPYGGDVQVVKLSGKTGLGMTDLEDAILTQAEMLDLRAPATGSAEGWVIESEVRRGLGSVATVLVRRGTLKPGNFVVAGHSWCKVRSLVNDAGVTVKSAGPGTPVQVLGWKDLPEAGDEVLEAPSESVAKQVVSNRIERQKHEKDTQDIGVLNEQRARLHQQMEEQTLRQQRLKMGLTVEPVVSQSEAGALSSNLIFIVKADVSGSAEAVQDSISGLGNDQVKAQVLYSGVGAVTETDVTRAEAANATILTFNLKPPLREVAALAARKNVVIIGHTIIYKLLEDVTERLTDQLEPEIRHKVLGEASVKDVFEISLKRGRKVHVAGCRVSNGSLARSAKVKVLRKGREVYVGTFESMKHHKDEVDEAKKDSECGLSFDGWHQFQPGDLVQTFDEMRVKRHL